MKKQTNQRCSLVRAATLDGMSEIRGEKYRVLAANSSRRGNNPRVQITPPPQSRSEKTPTT
jgi:hypothetical protein